MQPHLAGDLVQLRPLRPGDWENLFAVASDPLLWEQHPARDRCTEPVFRRFFRGTLESGGALAVIDRATQRIIGHSRYSGYDAAEREVEIGGTFLARSHWGGKYNGEMKRLMLDHAFRFVDRVLFLIGSDNTRSQRAIEKLGGIRTGRRDCDLDGRTIEHVIYQIRRP